MRIGWRAILAIVVAVFAIVSSILYLQLSQPKLEDTLIIYGPRGISGLATAFVREFKNRHPDVNVTFVSYGMGSIEIADKLILEKDSPVADVIMGVPEFYAKTLIDAGVLEPYRPQNISLIPAEEIWDNTGTVIPMDKGYVIITFNSSIIARLGIPPPERLDDLIRPEYRGLVFYQDPTSSGTGLSFLVWVLSVKGVEEGFSFLKQLEQNIKTHPSGWTSSIIALKNGEVAIGPMFNTDVGYEETPSLTSMAVEGFVYREGIALVKNAKHPEIAKKFIEFVLSTEAQNLVAPEGYMYPVNPKASVELLSYAPIPLEKVAFNVEIAGSVEQWLERWRREVKTG
ncbi:MAG: thiamine ABC transporter substrate-binding protein [Candidatus Brockarchaeota archaeon]|nr:thiamine ABC transporter substrate-binding protein [Candidatus Brockarchaeota archaeon]